MHLKTLKYSLIVFLGGASYGVMATTVKTAYTAGFDWTQTVASQGLFGALIFGVALIIITLTGKKPQRMKMKQIAKLVGTGFVGCSTTILYGYSLTMLPVAVAITLLFQFTWIGIVIQMIATRRRPHLAEIIAGLIIFFGTLLASSIVPGSHYGDLNPLGILCASLSAVSCATFMFLSGKVETKMPYIQRGFVICCGSALLGLVICPSYFSSGVLFEGIWKYGLILGTFGQFIPVLLFGIAIPHLPTGIATIMASSELPCAIAISIFILGEAIDGLQILGVVVILAGVVVSQVPYLRLAKNFSEQKVP